MSFYEHKAYINGKAYIPVIYKDGQYKQVMSYVNIPPATFSLSDGQELIDATGETFTVYARDTDLLG